MNEDFDCWESLLLPCSSLDEYHKFVQACGGFQKSGALINMDQNSRALVMRTLSGGSFLWGILEIRARLFGSLLAPLGFGRSHMKLAAQASASRAHSLCRTEAQHGLLGPLGTSPG